MAKSKDYTSDPIEATTQKKVVVPIVRDLRQQNSNQAVVIDVRREGVEIKPGVFRLERFVDGAEYIDALNRRYVWSIGRNIHDGRVEAAIDTRYYGDANWECLFLR